MKKRGEYGLRRKDFGRENLNRVIHGLEKIASDQGADYILVEITNSSDYDIYWNISGKAQLLVSNQKI